MAANKTAQNRASTIAKLQEIRETMGAAYGFIRGRESNTAISSLSFEQLLRQRIETIRGNPSISELRPSHLDHLEALKGALTKTIEDVKILPADALARDAALGTKFSDSPSTEDISGVNTLSDSTPDPNLPGS